MTTVQQLTEGISCHAWNANKSMIAICPNSNEVHIYSTVDWKRIHVLAEHDLLVTAIAWSSTNGKIVTCSHDRNAFVWSWSDGDQTWKPSLVILRIDRAATDVKWSLDGLRFAVGSGSKCVPVCMYEKSNDWWVSKMVKKHKSTVLCCAFHPSSGQILATGSADFRCRVFSTFDADVDDTKIDCGPFASPVEFGEVYADLPSQGWVNAVAWNLSGTCLAYAGHDSSLHVASFSSSSPPVVRHVRFGMLPLNCLLFLSDKALIGAGHDFVPLIFTRDDTGSEDRWLLFRALNGQSTAEQKTSSQQSEGETASASGVAAARALFQSKTTKGQERRTDSDSLLSMHDSAITCLSDCSTEKLKGRISTSALDGKLVIWDLPVLDVSMQLLGL